MTHGGLPRTVPRILLRRSQLRERMKSAAWVICSVALGASSLACNPFAPDQSVTLGVTTIDAPTTVASGATFTVTLTVVVGGCVTFDRIDVHADATGASLIALGTNSSIGRSGISCPQIIVYEPHAVQVKAGPSDPFLVEVDRGRLSPLQATVHVQ